MKQLEFKKFVKYFDSLIENILFKHKGKIKKFVKYVDFLIENILFKLKNKINNFFNKNSKVSNLNKLLISFITTLFFYLFYLLIPTLYDKTWVQNNIDLRLLKEFNINFSTSSDISYRILPAPHFLIKDSKIFKIDSEKKTSLAEIKNLKVFISQKNFLDKEKLFIKEVSMNNANFSLLKRDFKLLNDTNNKKFSKKKIKINNSNIFFKDNDNETIAIIKIFSSFLFYDDRELLNLFNMKGEIFNIPFIFDIESHINSSKKKEVSIKSKKLKLEIFNNSREKNENLINGSNIISILNSKIYTQYNIKNDLISFNSNNSRKKNSRVKYNGILSFNPFDLNLDVNLEDYTLSKLLNTNSIIGELIKTKLLFNENISIVSSITITNQSNEEIFNLSKINFNVVSGRINLDKTKLFNKKIGLLELDNSNLFFEENKLILKSDVLIDIKDSNNLFSFLQTNKKFRKPIKNIFINIGYDFLTKQIEFNNLKINDINVDNEILIILNQFNDNKSNNSNKSRRIFNKFFEAYAG